MRNKILAKLILFTPLEETLPYIKRKILIHMEPGVGHRMEVKQDWARNREIVKHVIGRIKL